MSSPLPESEPFLSSRDEIIQIEQLTHEINSDPAVNLHVVKDSAEKEGAEKAGREVGDTDNKESEAPLPEIMVPLKKQKSYEHTARPVPFAVDHRHQYLSDILLGMGWTQMEIDPALNRTQYSGVEAAIEFMVKAKADSIHDPEEMTDKILIENTDEGTQMQRQRLSLLLPSITRARELKKQSKSQDDPALKRAGIEITQAFAHLQRKISSEIALVDTKESSQSEPKESIQKEEWECWWCGEKGNNGTDCIYCRLPKMTNWICRLCMTENPPYEGVSPVQKCEVCYFDRVVGDHSSTQWDQIQDQKAPQSLLWSCTICARNDNSTPLCGTCSNPQKLDLLDTYKQLFDLVSSRNLTEARRGKERQDVEREEKKFKRHRDNRAQRVVIIEEEQRKLKGEEFKLKQKTGGIMNCGICFDDMDIRDLVDTTCLHLFCQPCWTHYLTSSVKEGRVLKILCPSPGCPRILEREDIIKFLDAKLISSYDKFHYDATMSLNPNARWCPTPDCGFVMVGDRVNTHLTCERCHAETCWSCNRPWHRGRCDFAARGIVSVTADEFNLGRYLASKSVRPCPQCRSPIDKDGGCNHMTCSHCRHEFCWNCGWSYTNLYYHDYSPLGCPLGLNLSFLGRDRCCCCFNCDCGCQLWFKTKRILFGCIAYPLMFTAALVACPFVSCFLLIKRCCDRC